MQEDIKNDIINIIKKSNVVFFSTINLDNIPETRALSNELNQENFKNNELYFTVHLNSPKIEQIKNNNNTSLYFYLIENMQNMTLFGKTEIVNDEKVKDSFWKEEFREYYSDGRNDVNYGIIKFIPNSYKYYAVKNNDYKKIEGKF